MENSLVFFSAAQLCKCTAKKMKFMREHPQAQKVSQDMLDGEAQAAARTIGLKEMGSFHEWDTYRMYYSIDEMRVKEGRFVFIEHKRVRDMTIVEPWFLPSSLLQCALYLSLHKLNGGSKYQTSKFEARATGNSVFIDLTKTKVRYMLSFGEEMYEVTVKKPEKIVEFFKKKAIASLEYDTAKVWDEQYRLKENDFIQKYYSYKKY